MTLQEILAAIQILNAVLPEASNLILSLRTPEGETVLNDLNAADAQNAVNIAQAEAFIEANKVAPEDPIS